MENHYFCCRACFSQHVHCDMACRGRKLNTFQDQCKKRSSRTSLREPRGFAKIPLATFCTRLRVYCWFVTCGRPTCIVEGMELLIFVKKNKHFFESWNYMIWCLATTPKWCPGDIKSWWSTFAWKPLRYYKFHCFIPALNTQIINKHTET